MICIFRISSPSGTLRLSLPVVLSCLFTEYIPCLLACLLLSVCTGAAATCYRPSTQTDHAFRTGDKHMYCTVGHAGCLAPPDVLPASCVHPFTTSLPYYLRVGVLTQLPHCTISSALVSPGLRCDKQPARAGDRVLRYLPS